ncbi:sodium-dependent transporter [Serpentinicella sp. ANB-PHB4]|uniref:sodium-dependent transporter n=1 Tax=Serpentinicella sp. ANB-PHB4 TaxID=3074076 RepID=UPI002856D775|nr:sodium-dependent transporter [Serpentinicella sp. ANB-PHB4]MDR5659792.1 sodium-dependent transporter [Serpentinicella sp. ANB-PHB4]
MSQKNEQWGSRWGFIMAAVGMAIGTGNIWRFPRVAAQNGGGPFIIAWTIALFVWAIPLLMGEMVMGRKTGLGTIGAFRDFAGKKYTWMGTWVAVVCLGIMFYYSVVMGWCIKYFTLAISGTFKPGMDTVATEAIWDTFTTTPSQTILFHFIAMIIAGLIIYRGVTKGIEKASKIMIPTLFILLVLAAIRAITLPGAAQGLEYLFNPDLSMLTDHNIWIQAFTQAAWSTGAGWGFIITYAVYTKQKEDIGGNCLIMGFGDHLGALVAGMTVLPAIFALSSTQQFAEEAMAQGNTGITFVYLSQLFTEMPLGNLIAAIFFGAMALAALSSLLPMIEVGVRNLMDMGIERKKATIYIAVAGFILGVPSAYSLHFMDNQDWVWSIGLLVSGLFVAFALIKFGLEKVRKEVINLEGADFKIGKWWSVFVGLFPVFFVVITGWWLYQSTTWYPDTWWHPFEKESFGTVIFQFTIVIAAALALNNWLANKVGKGRDITKGITKVK